MISIITSEQWQIGGIRNKRHWEGWTFLCNQSMAASSIRRGSATLNMRVISIKTSTERKTTMIERWKVLGRVDIPLQSSNELGAPMTFRSVKEMISHGKVRESVGLPNAIEVTATEVCATKSALVPGLQHQGSSIRSPASSLQHPVSSIQSPAGRVQHPGSSIQGPASRVQHPESSIQSPDPGRKANKRQHKQNAGSTTQRPQC